MRNAEVLARLDDAEAAIRRARAALKAADELLTETADDFARRRKVSVYTVRRWCKAGMPHSHPPGGYRIPVHEAEAWLDSGGKVVDIQRSARRAAWAGR